ncbi:hypothetical protein, partial [Nonomuraea sp. B5E05]|uniref:hypothetical protein n=1 Tax=Nonomuraea sp. B5E05 TaxID=3153569 RepID=UPI00326003C9
PADLDRMRHRASRLPIERDQHHPTGRTALRANPVIVSGQSTSRWAPVRVARSSAWSALMARAKGNITASVMNALTMADALGVTAAALSTASIRGACARVFPQLEIAGGQSDAEIGRVTLAGHLHQVTGGRISAQGGVEEAVLAAQLIAVELSVGCLYVETQQR